MAPSILCHPAGSPTVRGLRRLIGGRHPIRRTGLVLCVGLLALGCKDQAPPPTIAGQFSGTADVDHGFYGFLRQIATNVTVQQNESFLTGSMRIGTTTFTLAGTADLNTGQTTLQLTDAVNTGGSPSPCNGYSLGGEALFFQSVNEVGTAPLVLRGEVMGTDCDGTMTVTFEAERQ